jgi:hypothetical protein
MSEFNKPAQDAPAALRPDVGRPALARAGGLPNDPGSASNSAGIDSSTASEDDLAWEAVLAKPENKSARAELVEGLQSFAEGGNLGEPEVFNIPDPATD